VDRDFYLKLAAAGLRMPIGTDLVLHEQPDPEKVKCDAEALGRVMEEAAARYGTPLAFPLMDLRLEKADLLRLLGIEEPAADGFHFEAPPLESDIARVRESARRQFSRRNAAHIGSVRYIRERTALVPVGMAIGPFSLMTKLMADPITAVALAGTGVTGADDPSVLLAERALVLAELAVRRSVRAQIEAGAKAMLICEPAANRVYISPKQVEAGAGVFERFVMQPNLRLKRLLEDSGVDLIFHDCGELTTEMVRQFATRLDPAILSLGSSRKLWEDAAVTPRNVVLFGNLPTKNFYSDAAMPLERVGELTEELIARMREAAHPHILGSECDVLHVPEAAQTIRRKVDRMLGRG
jgi:uroporphyrinogen-III decarboxylase